ncbi:MAG: D-alanyl-D-alanine carboxypeptidase [Clostridia bacterium]|nr:D-alanyl-D-alanine carboxypeptidase [Clostridia bacterium]
MKKLCVLLSIITAMVICSAPAFCVEFNEEACSLYLMDMESGTVIYNRDSHIYTNISGLNKLMGVALVLEAIKDGRLKPSDEVIVSESIRGVGGATAFLEVGAAYSVEELLKAVATNNANDAMIALSEKVYGSVDAFVEKMNLKAQELGLIGTSFTNVTGFEDESQLSTAEDVAALSAYVISLDGYTKYCNEYMYELQHPSGRKTEIVNTNRLIKTYDACDGLMSGSDRNKNYSVAATGKKGDMRLIAVVLNAPNSDVRNSTARQMLEYGFTNYTSKRVYSKGEEMFSDFKLPSGDKKLSASIEKELKVVLEKGTEKGVEKSFYIKEDILPPVKEGDVVGEAYALLDGQIIGTVNIVADFSVEKLTMKKCCKNIMEYWIGA